MDHKPTKPDTDSWVDDRMAKLDPAPEWKPDAGPALERLTHRKPAFNSQWMRLAMTTTILAATGLVLVLLPWQRLWTPKPVDTPKVVAATVPQTGTAPQESPAPKPSAETAPQAPAVPAPQPADGKVLPDLSDNEKVVREDLAELAKARADYSPRRIVEGALAEFAKAQGIAAQASQPGVTEPQVLHQVIPGYSDEARQAKVTGTVELTITVKVDGTVQFEGFKKSLGHGLDEKAREAIEQWTFTPAKKDGVPFAKTVDVSMNFSLK